MLSPYSFPECHYNLAVTSKLHCPYRHVSPPTTMYFTCLKLYLQGLSPPLGCFPKLFLVTQSCPTLCDPMDCSSPSSSVHGDSPDKNTEVGCHVLHLGIFLTQGSNWQLLCLLHWQASSLPRAPPRNPASSSRLSVIIRVTSDKLNH